MTTSPQPAAAEGPLATRRAASGRMRILASVSARPRQAGYGIDGAPGASRRQEPRPPARGRLCRSPARPLCAPGHYFPGMQHTRPGAPDSANRQRHADPTAPPPPPPRLGYVRRGVAPATMAEHAKAAAVNQLGYVRRGVAPATPSCKPAGRAPKAPGGPRGAGPHGGPPDATGAPAPGEVPPLCPFCGGRGLPKKPGMGRLSGSSVSVGAASLRLVVDSKGEEYYKCHGCDMSFVFADREIGTMLPGMMVSLSVPIRIKHYYGGGVSARDLLTRHRTATVRKVRGRLSFFSSKTARNELVVCFNCNGVRTFGSFRRRRGDNGYYYTFEGLDRA